MKTPESNITVVKALYKCSKLLKGDEWRNAETLYSFQLKEVNGRKETGWVRLRETKTFSMVENLTVDREYEMHLCNAFWNNDSKDYLIHSYPVYISDGSAEVIRRGNKIEVKGEFKPFMNRSPYPKKILTFNEMDMLWHELENVRVDIYIINYIRALRSPVRLRTYFNRDSRISEKEISFYDKMLVVDTVEFIDQNFSREYRLCEEDINKIVDFIKNHEYFDPKEDHVTYNEMYKMDIETNAGEGGYFEDYNGTVYKILRFIPYIGHDYKMNAIVKCTHILKSGELSKQEKWRAMEQHELCKIKEGTSLSTEK